MVMATDVAQVIRTRLQEIDKELAGLEPLRDERERLERALQEIGEAAPRADGGRGRGSRKRPGARSGGRRASRGTGKRAPRGQNLRVIADHIESHPDTSAPEIAEATGIDRAVVYSALSRMITNGRLTKSNGDDGRVTYRVAAETA